jgi:hypothetical protein
MPIVVLPIPEALDPHGCVGIEDVARSRAAWLADFVGRLQKEIDNGPVVGVPDAVLSSTPVEVDLPREPKKRCHLVEVTVSKGRAGKKAAIGLAGDLIARDLVSVLAEVRGMAGTMDLTEEATLWPRYRKGRWSAVADPSGGSILSRIVDEYELARNTGRIPADGLCGYLSLQWAAEGSGFDESMSDLHLEASRVRLVRFLDRLLRGCTDDRIRRKLELVQINLEHSLHPWRLGRDSGGWLDIGDLAHLNIDFPLVVWGSDMGGGHRRVRYPLAANGPFSSAAAAGALSRSEGQVILDSDHFFPLDSVAGEGAEEVVAAAGVDDARARGARGELQTQHCGLSAGPGPAGGADLEAGKRGVAVVAQRRKRNAGVPAERDEEGHEALDGTRRRKEARSEPGLGIGVAASQDVVWGGDLPD